MKNLIIITVILCFYQTCFSQNNQVRYNSISEILLIGKNKISNIEDNYRIVEKTVYDIMFKEGSTANSSTNYSLYGDRTYRFTAFTDETNKVGYLYLKAYKFVNNEWKLDKENSTYGKSIDLRVEPLKSTYYKIEVSCTFKNSTDNYVRYGLFIDREL